MRAKTIGALSFAFNLVVLFIGCSGARPPAETSPHGPKYGLVREGEPCLHDTDCRSGLCNRHQCGGVHGIYGNQCDPPSFDAPPVEKLPEHLCGPLLCVEGRCRSCRSDAECQSYFGMGKCTPVPSADRPGYAECRPSTTRLQTGAECTRDEECRSLLCDRTRCADVEALSRNGYSNSCRSRWARPSPPPLDLRKTGPRYGCQGYLCINDRCQSCQSDAECQQGGASQLKCREFLDWPGKVCVTDAEIARYPEPPRVIVSIAPTVDAFVEDDDEPPPPPAKRPTAPPACPSSLPRLTSPLDGEAPFFYPGALIWRTDVDGGQCWEQIPGTLTP